VVRTLGVSLSIQILVHGLFFYIAANSPPKNWLMFIMALPFVGLGITCLYFFFNLESFAKDEK